MDTGKVSSREPEIGKTNDFHWMTPRAMPDQASYAAP